MTEAERQRNRRYYVANKEHIKARARGYYAKNMEKVKANLRARYADDPEFKLRVLSCNKEWAVKNVTKVEAYQAQYRDEHREESREYKREWFQENKSRIIKQRHERRRTDLNFRLADYLRSRITSAVKGDWKAGSAVADLGITIEEFKLWIYSQFEGGMGWDNYGEWHLDHVKPLASFDLADREQFLEACNWLNYQPLWAKDNLRKGAR